MSQIRPLSYIASGSGSVPPGSILTLLRSSRGLTGQWTAPIAEEVLDTEGTPTTVADMARSYNQLVWDFGRLGVLSTEPRMWFGEAGSTGLHFKIIYNGVAFGIITYKPYNSTPTTLSLTDLLATLNSAFNVGSNIQLVYTNGRINLIVKSGYSIEFIDNSPPGTYDTPMRIMRRLLPNVEGGLESMYTGQVIVQGDVLPGPIAGLYPIPAAPGMLSATEITNTSMLLSWTASPQPPGISGLKFKVFKDGILAGEVSNNTTTYNLVGLTAGKTYIVSVIAATDYEISVGNPSTTVETTGGIPTVFNLNSTDIGYTTLTVSWTPTGTYNIHFTQPQAITINASVGSYQFTSLQQNQTYTVSAVLDNTVGSTISPTTRQIPAPNVVDKSWSGTTVTYTLDIQNPAVLIESDQKIKYDIYLNNGSIVRTTTFDANTTINILTGLNADTTYIVYAYYQLADSQKSGLRYVDNVGPARFLALGTSAPVYYDPAGITIKYTDNGTSWSDVGSIFTNGASKAAYGSGKWVAVGRSKNADGLTIKYSTDGLVWSDSTNGFTQWGGGVATDLSGSKWMAVGTPNGASRSIKYSINGGISWTDTPTEEFPDAAWCAATNGSRWLVGGDSMFPLNTPSNSTKSIKYSDDFGQTWNLTSGGYTYGCTCIVWAKNIWVCTGTNYPYNNDYQGIKYSTDNGISWNNAQGDTIPMIGRGIAWNGKMFVAVGDACPIKWSNDGIYWYNADFGSFTQAGGSVAWVNGIWIASGLDTGSVVRLKYSSDGRNWNNASQVNPSFTGISSVVAGHKSIM